MKLNTEIKLRKPQINPIQFCSYAMLIVALIATISSMIFCISSYLSLNKQVSTASANLLLNQKIVDQAAQLIQENTVQFQTQSDQDN